VVVFPSRLAAQPAWVALPRSYECQGCLGGAPCRYYLSHCATPALHRAPAWQEGLHKQAVFLGDSWWRLFWQVIPFWVAETRCP
jgi:hypothetical protein